MKRHNYKIRYTMEGEVWIRSENESDAKEQFQKFMLEWLLKNLYPYPKIETIWKSDMEIDLFNKNLDKL